MTLEDFEKALAEEKHATESSRDQQPSGGDGHRSKHHHSHRHHHHHRSKKHSAPDDEEDRDASRRKRSRRSSRGSQDGAAEGARGREKKEGSQATSTAGDLQRDAWMERPSSLDVDYVQRDGRNLAEPATAKSSAPDFHLKVHKNELNHHLHDLNQGKDLDSISDEPIEEEVNYTFGDSGARWRMTKLRGVATQAEASGRPIDEVAQERFGSLRAYDEAREEQIELDRRETYGKGYVGKEKPTGDLYEERKKIEQSEDEQRRRVALEESRMAPFGEITDAKPTSMNEVKLDQTSLNRLKAQIMKARLKGTSNLPALEAEYEAAVTANPIPKEPTTVVLGSMENRMLAGGRRGEVVAIDNKRGRERGLVKDNEDMSIEDMVREERRTKGQAGGDGKRFAERIAKDAKFDDDHDYLDENATKLAKRVQRSEIDLKNIAINDFQKTNRILDSCPLCHHEDKDLPPIAPLISLATRVYLTLPTDPEVSEGGACIVPIQHRSNLLECDDDEWEEIRNFMKSLIRMYHDQGREVIFYENAAAPQKRRHAAMEVVPLPYSLGETAPAFFKEAILTSDEEWTQHKKLIDTLARANSQGLGKQAFRRSIAKEMPYFHVWFEINGGLGHIVEDSNRWPKGDLFAREVLGGMLDVEPQIIKRQGRWTKGEDRRVDGFKKRWRKFDWTRVLTDG